MRVVLDKGHNPAMTQLLDALDPEIAANVIDAGQDGPSIVLAIQQAVAAGAAGRAAGRSRAARRGRRAGAVPRRATRRSRARRG